MTVSRETHGFSSNIDEKTISLQWNGIKLLVPKDEPNVFYSTYLFASYRKLRLRPSDTVLDIGAHVGDFTLLSSRAVGNTGLVIALEPNPRLYSILERNLRANSIRNVICQKVAVYNSISELTMSDKGQGTMIERDDINDVSFVTPSTTIDSILEQQKIKCAQVLKMDIEGAEYEALKNQESIKYVRDVAIEVHSEDLHAKVERLLIDVGFDVENFSKMDAFTNLLFNSVTHLPSLFLAEAKCKAIGFRTGIGSAISRKYVGPSTTIIFGRRK